MPIMVLETRMPYNYTTGYSEHHLHKCWHAFICHKLYRRTFLAPEGIGKSISGPRPKKVVHHWSRAFCGILFCLFELTLSYWTRLSTKQTVASMSSPRPPL